MRYIPVDDVVAAHHVAGMRGEEEQSNTGDLLGLHVHVQDKPSSERDSPGKEKETAGLSESAERFSCCAAKFSCPCVWSGRSRLQDNSVNGADRDQKISQQEDAPWPGETVFTRICLSAHSAASACRRWRTATLDEL